MDSLSRDGKPLSAARFGAPPGGGPAGHFGGLKKCSIAGGRLFSGFGALCAGFGSKLVLFIGFGRVRGDQSVHGSVRWKLSNRGATARS